MSAGKFTRRRRRASLLGLASIGAASLLAFAGTGAFGASVSTAAFSGGTGTAVVGSTLYAKSEASLTLNVTTSSGTKGVELTGAHAARQTSTTAKSSWTFNLTADSGDGVQAVTA